MIIRIKQYAFEVADIYSAGYVLNASEAVELNRLRAENVRNNVKRLFVDKALAGVGDEELISASELALLIEKVEFYAKHYAFDPIKDRERQTWFERELRLYAADLVEAEARKAGVELSDEALLAEVEKKIRQASVIEQAMERAKVMNETAQQALEDLLS